MSPESLRALAEHCRDAGHMTLTNPEGFSPPPGFPRGELLSQTMYEGKPIENRTYDPEKVIRWLDRNGL